MITFLVFRKQASPLFTVSGSCPAFPRSRNEATSAGIADVNLYRSITCTASAKVEVSDAVGPEAITSSRSPMTSERISVTTVAGRAA